MFFWFCFEGFGLVSESLFLLVFKKYFKKSLKNILQYKKTFII